MCVHASVCGWTHTVFYPQCMWVSIKSIFPVHSAKVPIDPLQQTNHQFKQRGAEGEKKKLNKNKQSLFMLAKAWFSSDRPQYMWTQHSQALHTHKASLVWVNKYIYTCFQLREQNRLLAFEPQTKIHYVNEKFRSEQTVFESEPVYRPAWWPT